MASNQSVFGWDVKSFVLRAMLGECPFFYYPFLRSAEDLTQARIMASFRFIVVEFVIALNCRSLVHRILKAPPHKWLIIVLVWGALRLDQPVPGQSVSVAAVVTGLGPTEHGLPDREALTQNTHLLFDRTRIAASRGARLVVWNEIATVVQPEEEAGLVNRGRSIARELGIDLVLAYGVLAQSDPVLFDNKYAFISDAGEVLDEYRKHHPVPGEPSIRARASGYAGTPGTAARR